MVGTRWSKSEDDGLFYAVWSLFTYTRCTGDDRLLRQGTLELLFRNTLQIPELRLRPGRNRIEIVRGAFTVVA
ncbi:MAG: hypothetical protein ACLFVC_09165 [Opitutales bacterium]